MFTCWREEGGEAVTFGSDAHDPTLLARAFVEAGAMVEATASDRPSSL
jgi:histidinol-phosphatase (PHP family)